MSQRPTLLSKSWAQSQLFVSPGEARHATRDETRTRVNASITALIPSPWSQCSVCVATLFFNRLPEADGWHADCIPTRAGEPPTTTGGRNEHHNRNDPPQFQARKPLCADRAGTRTDQTVIGIRRLLAARQRTASRSLLERSFDPATKGFLGCDPANGTTD